MYKIFISHSSKDKGIIDILNDKLLGNGMEFAHSEVFCTSIEGQDIEIGDDWRNAIRNSLLSSDVILLILTPNYIESKICQNEMGAAWASDKAVIPIIVPPIGFSMIGVTFDVRQAIDITKSSDLDKLRDKLCEILSKAPLPTDKWNTKKLEAKSLIESYLSSNTFLTPVTRDALDEIEKELHENKTAVKTLSLENQKLKELCNQLEKAKSKEDVIVAKRDTGFLSEYDLFFEKVSKLNQNLSKVDSIVLTTIFIEHTKKYLNYSNSTNAFTNAVAEDLINEDGEPNYSHPVMKKIKDEIKEFENFFDKISSETFELIENDYPGIPLEISNLSFWEQVLSVKLSYNR